MSVKELDKIPDDVEIQLRPRGVEQLLKLLPPDCPPLTHAEALLVLIAWADWQNGNSTQETYEAARDRILEVSHTRQNG